MSTRTIKSNSAGHTENRFEQSEAEPLVCFKCGTTNPFAYTFCTRCGAKLFKPLGAIVNMTHRQPAGVQQEAQTEIQQSDDFMNEPIIAPIKPIPLLHQDNLYSHTDDDQLQNQDDFYFDSEDALLQQHNDIQAHSDDVLPQQQTDMPSYLDDAQQQKQTDMPSHLKDAQQQKQNDIPSRPNDVLQQYNDMQAQSDDVQPQPQDNMSSGLDDALLSFSAQYISGQSHQTVTPSMPAPSVTQASVSNPSQERIGFNPQSYSTAEISEDDFIKKNTHYYRQKFMEMRMENKKTGWNWAAWFFNVFWCFYRKMYLVGIIFAGIQLLGLLAEAIAPILNLLTALILGILGNHFYMRYTTDTLKEAQNLPELQRYTYLRKKGGTSIGAVVILIVSVILIGFVIGFMEAFLSFIV